MQAERSLPALSIRALAVVAVVIGIVAAIFAATFSASAQAASHFSAASAPSTVYINQAWYDM